MYYSKWKAENERILKRQKTKLLLFEQNSWHLIFFQIQLINRQSWTQKAPCDFLTSDWVTFKQEV